MKILRTNILKNGQISMRVVLDANEIIQCIKPNLYYKLRGKFSDIVPSHAFENPRPVYWCDSSQEWVSVK